MLGRLFKKYLGATSDTADQPTPTDGQAYAFLDTVKRGLAHRARTYLATGNSSDVLADLKATVGANPNYLPARPHRDAVMATNALCYGLGGRPDALARFAELRHAMGWGFSLTTQKGSEHLDAIPDIVRVLLSAFSAGQGTTSDTPTTWGDVRAAVKRLGGRDVDIVLYFLPAHRRFYRAPEIPSVKGIFADQFDTEVFVEALAGQDANVRGNVLQHWAKMSFVKEPAFLPFLFDQGQESSVTLRKNAAALLPLHDAEAVTKRAIEMLAAKKATARLFAVEALAAVGGEQASDALVAHRKTETSQSVLTALELLVGGPATAAPTVDSGYIDASGTHVPLPPEVPLVDDGSSPLGDDFVARFRAVEAKMRQDAEDKHARRLEYWTKQGKTGNKPEMDAVHPVGEAWLKILNNPVARDPQEQRGFVPYLPYYYADLLRPIVEEGLDRIPQRRAIDLACKHSRSLSSLLDWRNEPLSRYVQGAIANGQVSFAQVVKIAKQFNMGHENSASAEDRASGDIETGYLRQVLSTRRYYGDRSFVPGIWQIAAGHLPLLIASLPPRGTDFRIAQRALEVIADFPSLPAELIQPLLFVAIDDRARLRDPAQKLLADAPGIDDQLIKILDDKRQGVRANAARFLADRNAVDAVPALIRKLKTEKSELARADFISAVARLGGATTAYLGRDALLNEARTLVEKLPAEKLNWLDLSTAPRLFWADGSAADPVLLQAWLRLALKLKSPLGSPLFGLYFDQMTPESVTAVADWILNTWITYDTDRPVGAAARAEAEERAKRDLANKSSWMAHVGYSLEDLTEIYLQSIATGYPNSGADSKGILALTHRATPATAGPMIARYLKQHGKRVSQAKALVETLYGMGSQDAVQVLVATATRFKQRTVRELAEQLVADLAEARGWTQDELADRSVPTGGFEDDGTMVLEVGEDAKPYLARLDSDLTVGLFNPQGKAVKSIPAGSDANTNESKALLSAAKKVIKAAQIQQQSRLYDAMVSGRVWGRQAWQDDLTHHPIMRRLIERVIWRGLSDNGEFITGLRLTPEGEFLDASGDDVDIGTISKIDIAHTANLPEAASRAWLDHLRDFEVKPLFAQVSRPVRTLTNAEGKDTRLTDRMGWMMTTFKLRAAAKKAGYDRGPIGDGGGFDTYRKEFRGAKIWADLYFTGSYVSEDDIPAAIKYMQFAPMDDGGASRALTLEKVPALLLSEVWNDLHEIAKSGAFDRDWESKGLY